MEYGNSGGAGQLFSSGCQGAGSEDAPRGQNVPGAQAQIKSVKAIFEKYNLLGVSAQDCTKPPKAVENWYYVNRLIDANHVQRDLMESPATRKSVTIIDNAAEATPNGILVIGTRDGKPARESGGWKKTEWCSGSRRLP